MDVGDVISTHWVSGIVGMLGVLIGAVMTVVGGTWRARGMLAGLEEQDAAAKTSIENIRTQIGDLKGEVEDMREQIKVDRTANDLRHKENTIEMHRIANAVMALPNIERFNRLEDRMMDLLKQALIVQPHPIIHRKTEPA